MFPVPSALVLFPPFSDSALAIFSVLLVFASVCPELPEQNIRKNMTSNPLPPDGKNVSKNPWKIPRW